MRVKVDISRYTRKSQEQFGNGCKIDLQAVRERAKRYFRERRQATRVPLNEDLSRLEIANTKLRQHLGL